MVINWLNSLTVAEHLMLALGIVVLWIGLSAVIVELTDKSIKVK